MAEQAKLPLGKLLIQKGVISEDQLRIALQEQRKNHQPLGRLLVRLGFLSEATVQVGVSNLTDRKYVSTIGSNGFSNSDPTGTGQTLLVGAPRQVFVTLSAKL